MHTTADARELFVEVDGTVIGSESYQFNYAVDAGPVDIKAEGEVLDRSATETKKKTVHFEDFSTKEKEMRLAREELLDGATSVLAGAPLDQSFDYDTLYIDRETDNAYLVDTNRFGYCVGLYEDAAVRVR